MDGNSFRSTFSDLAVGSAMAAAARDYKKELLATEKAQSKAPDYDEVALDELMDDPELEQLHAERIASLKKEAEKRHVLQQKGHGEYREVTEAEFLGEVTGSKKAVCHFFHQEFMRCKIMDKHLKVLATKHLETKFIKVDAEKCPFFVSKLAIKVLPCVILFRDGVSVDRILGFQELGGVDDFRTSALEARLVRKDIISAIEKENLDGDEKESRNLRSTTYADSDSD